MVNATVKSAFVNGIDAIPVDVEVTVNEADSPSFVIVGLPDVYVLEGCERVRAAIRSAGFEFPRGRIVANLSPASVKKHGTGFDLAIAEAILVATRQVPPLPADSILVGELMLGGRVRPVRGTASVAGLARDLSCRLYVSNSAHDARIASAQVFGVSDISELRDPERISSLMVDVSDRDSASLPDFVDIPCSDFVKKACQVSVAGGLPLLFIGDVCLASKIAACIPSIMPPMTVQESFEVARAYSASSMPAPTGRPFRAPHWTVNVAGLVGGGRPVYPGEATLANNGLLYLEDVSEFTPAALQSLRQPIDEKSVRIVRADGVYVMPADFILLASAKPCPCGGFGTLNRPCGCTPIAIERYRNRICGPLTDRFAIFVDLVAVQGSGTSSADLAEGVAAAREFSTWRADKLDDASDANLEYVCRFDDSAARFFSSMVVSHGYTLAARDNVLRIARALADMNQRLEVSEDDLALGFSMFHRH